MRDPDGSRGSRVSKVKTDNLVHFFSFSIYLLIMSYGTGNALNAMVTKINTTSLSLEEISVWWRQGHK